MVSREAGEEQIILYLEEHKEASIIDVANGIKRSSNFVRTRLAKMEGTGEVTFREERPRKFYRLTKKTGSAEFAADSSKSDETDTSLQM
jgi:predicted ArsR family transcriptional regulator